MGEAKVYTSRTIRKSHAVVGKPHGLAEFIRANPAAVLQAFAAKMPSEGSHEWAKECASQCGVDPVVFDAAVHLIAKPE